METKGVCVQRRRQLLDCGTRYRPYRTPIEHPASCRNPLTQIDRIKLIESRGRVLKIVDVIA